jgi:hypothetical protein
MSSLGAREIGHQVFEPRIYLIVFALGPDTTAHCRRGITSHFQASKAFPSIATPSEDFWNASFAMRSSLSSSGNSNQARV